MAPQTVDSKTPRGKAAFHTILPALAYVLDVPFGPYLVAFTGLAMAVSVIGGPKVSLFGRVFKAFVRPVFKVKEGEPQEAAPHKFAEAVGAAFLLAATIAFVLGATTFAWVLTLAVAGLAALNWLAGICVGCQMYILGRRLISRSRAVA